MRDANFKHRRAQKGGGAAGRSTLRLCPLRRVVDHSGDRLQWDVLECGHKLYQASDIFGQRFPTRRRCRHCGPLAALKAGEGSG